MENINQDNNIQENEEIEVLPKQKKELPQKQIEHLNNIG